MLLKNYFRTTADLKVLENSQRNVFLVALLLSNSSCPIFPSSAILKTDSIAIVSCECSENCSEFLFSKLKEEISKFHKNSNTCNGMFRVAGLQPAVCKANKNQLNYLKAI